MYIQEAKHIGIHVPDSDDLGNIFLEKKCFLVQEPDYTGIIPSNVLRRMGKAVRLGMGVALPIIQKNPIDAIIMGTANGGLEDCIKFLNQIVEFEEGVLTPTNFVQSTPNALAGQLAILTQNHCYNNTHTNNALSFENALIDLKLQFEDNDRIQNAVVGAVDEISAYNFTIDCLTGIFIKKDQVAKNWVLENYDGAIAGEGATMFYLTKHSNSSTVQIKDISIRLLLDEHEILENIKGFLLKNQLSVNDIHVISTGRNGDKRYQSIYDQVEALFPSAALNHFKSKCAEYKTATGFAVYEAFQTLQHQTKASHYLIFNTLNQRQSLILIEKKTN